jgi:hypothetical protein
MKRFCFAVAVCAFACFSQAARANLIQNGSFEISTATTTTQFLSAGVADWTNSDIGEALVFPSWFTNGYLFPPNVGLAGNFPQSSPDGGNFVYSDGDYHHSPILQTVTGLTVGDTYDLSFYQALDEDTEPNVTHPGPVTGYWQVSLGASTQNSTFMTGDGSIPTFTNWNQQTMSFTATTVSEVLSFFSVGTGDPPLVMLDGVSLVDSTAPEPASLWLMGIAAAFLGWKVVRHRKAV